MTGRRIKEIVYTVTTALDEWGAGGVPAGCELWAFGNVAKENFIARRLLIPSAESLRWNLLSLEVEEASGEITDRLIIDGGVRIGSLTEPGAPEFELRVKHGSRVRALVHNLEACSYVFRLTLVGPICEAMTWTPRYFA